MTLKWTWEKKLNFKERTEGNWGKNGKTQGKKIQGKDFRSIGNPVRLSRMIPTEENEKMSQPANSDYATGIPLFILPQFVCLDTSELDVFCHSENKILCNLRCLKARLRLLCNKSLTTPQPEPLFKTA